jgi:Asp-tRNA(Asn)/Glu-tRNA(Gln) amidotransferase A subunit family amidase
LLLPSRAERSAAGQHSGATVEGLPVGLSIVGGSSSDAMLIATAAALTTA